MFSATIFPKGLELPSHSEYSYDFGAVAPFLPFCSGSETVKKGPGPENTSHLFLFYQGHWTGHQRETQAHSDSAGTYVITSCTSAERVHTVVWLVGLVCLLGLVCLVGLVGLFGLVGLAGWFVLVGLVNFPGWSASVQTSSGCGWGRGHYQPAT